MLLCTAGFGILLLTGVLDLNTIPQLVDHLPGLAVAVILPVCGEGHLRRGGIQRAGGGCVADLPAPGSPGHQRRGHGYPVPVHLLLDRTLHPHREPGGLLNKHPKLQKYFAATQEYGFVSCFAIHMLGLNMEVLGVLFGMMRLNYWSYLASSWLAIMPGMVCFCILGNNLDFRNPVFWAC